MSRLCDFDFENAYISNVIRVSLSLSLSRLATHTTVQDEPCFIWNRSTDRKNVFIFPQILSSPLSLNERKPQVDRNNRDLVSSCENGDIL